MADAVLVVLGDSTGNDTNEWVYLTAQYLATGYPAYTVLQRLWNDTNQNYDAATSIQTGSGAKTLTVYNASTSGKDASYSSGSTRLALQLPVAPHAVIVNYAHNTSGTTVRAVTFALARAISDLYPSAPIVLTAQNPRISSDADYANDLARQQSVIDLAASEGYGLVNVLQAFLVNPTYAADWLSGDGLHPNAAGSVVWANEVKKHLVDASTVRPTTAPPRFSRLWLPASAFVLDTGTPTLAVVNAREPGWALADAVTSGVATTYDIPPSWGSVNFYVSWETSLSTSGLTGSTNAVRWELATRQTGAFTSPTSGSTSPGGTGGYATTPVTGLASNVGAAYARHDTLLLGGYAATGRPLVVRVRRLGADANDTLADTVHFIGLWIERAS